MAKLVRKYSDRLPPELVAKALADAPVASVPVPVAVAEAPHKTGRPLKGAKPLKQTERTRAYRAAKRARGELATASVSLSAALAGRLATIQGITGRTNAQILADALDASERAG